MEILSGYSVEQILVSNLGLGYWRAAQNAQANDKGPLLCLLDIGETNQTLTCAVTVTPIASAFVWSRCIQWRGNWTDRIEYKKITRPGDIKRLQRFLEASDRLCGTLLVLSIPKSDLVFSDNNDGEIEEWSAQLGFSLSKKLFKRIRIVSAVMTAALVPFKHDFDFIHWWSDRDEMFEPKSRAIAVQELLSTRLSRALATPMKPRLTTEDGVRDRLWVGDMIAIPDIAAGGIADYSLRRNEYFGPAEGLYVTSPPGTKPKAETVAEWFGLPQRGLAKVALELSAERNNQGMRTNYVLSPMSFELVNQLMLRI